MSWIKIVLLAPIILFAAFVVAGVLLNVFYAGWCFLFILVLHTRNDNLDQLGYWLSAGAGIVVTAWLFRSVIRQFSKPATNAVEIGAGAEGSWGSRPPLA